MGLIQGSYVETRGCGWVITYRERGGEQPVGKDKPHEKLNTEFLPSAGQTSRQTLLVPTINTTVFSGSTKWAVEMPKLGAELEADSVIQAQHNKYRIC